MMDPNARQDNYGVEGYQLKPALRFNFNRDHMIPKSKKETYLDHLMKEKKKIPSPDKYLCNVHKTNFNDMNKKSKIYMFDRKSTMKDIAKEGKKNPGVGKYQTEHYDELRNRPPRGLYKASLERITLIDEARAHGMSIPSKYNDVPLNSIKPRPYQQIKYHPDSEHVKNAEIKRWKKNNSPSPTSYEFDKSMEKCSGSEAQDRSGRYYTLAKGKRQTYVETIQVKSKKFPGVGQYNSHVALDKASRPYMRKR